MIQKWLSRVKLVHAQKQYDKAIRKEKKATAYREECYTKFDSEFTKYTDRFLE